MCAEQRLYVLTLGTGPGGEQHAEDIMGDKVIGTITGYQGTEHPYLRGYQIKVLAIFKGAALPDYDPDDGYAVATSDDELARLGGLAAGDRAEVVPWLESESRFSFVSSDPRVEDLDAFRNLAGNN